MKRRSKLIGKAFCCCEVTVGFSRDGHGNRTPRPELRRCGRKTLRLHTPSYLAPLRRGLFSCRRRARRAAVTSRARAAADAAGTRLRDRLHGQLGDQVEIDETEPLRARRCCRCGSEGRGSTAALGGLGRQTMKAPRPHAEPPKPPQRSISKFGIAGIKNRTTRPRVITLYASTSPSLPRILVVFAYAAPAPPKK
jgi:hypothetical protein